MDLKKFISGISALSIAASAFAAVTITASAAVYADQVVDLSGFGTYDSSTNTSSFSIGNSTWQKLDLTPYTQRTGETTTKVTVSYTNKVASGGRNVIGFFDEDLAEYPASWGGTSGSAAAYGEQDSSSGQRTFFGQTQIGRAKGIYPMDVDFDVNLTFDYVTGKVSGTIGSTTYTDQDLKSVNSIDTFAIMRWNGTLTYEIKDFTITLETSSVAKVTRTIESKCGSLVLDSATVTNLPGETYSYSPSAYLKDSNDNYYKYDGITELGAVPAVTGTIPSDDDTISLSYTKVDDVVAFAEVSSLNNDGTHGAFAAPATNGNASGGQDGGIVYGGGNRCVQGFTVPALGQYRITVNAVGTTSNTRSCYLTVDSTDTADSLATLSCNNGSFAVQSFVVDLAPGSHNLYYTSNNGVSPTLDYMVVELVQEYTAPTVAAELVQDNIAADEGYTGEDAGDVYSVFKATVTAGTKAITSLYFTLNSGAKSTPAYSETTIASGSPAIFGLVVPMASSAVEDITAVIDGANYVAFE